MWQIADWWKWSNPLVSQSCFWVLADCDELPVGPNVDFAAVEKDLGVFVFLRSAQKEKFFRRLTYTLREGPEPRRDFVFNFL